MEIRDSEKTHIDANSVIKWYIINKWSKFRKYKIEGRVSVSNKWNLTVRFWPHVSVQSGGAGVLGTVVSANENDRLWNQVRNQDDSQNKCYWLGLKRFSNAYLWDDGSDLTYENWAENDDRKNPCVCMNAKDRLTHNLYRNYFSEFEICSENSIETEIEKFSPLL